MEKSIEQKIIDALNKTWNQIGYDVIQLNGGKAVSKSEVMDCVPDYLYQYDKTASEEFFKLDTRQQNKILKKAFTFSKYGM